MRKRTRTAAGMLMCLMIIGVLSAGAAVNAADYEHAFHIGANGSESLNTYGSKYRGTGDVNNPWKVRLEVTTEGGDLITRFGLRRNRDNAVVSASLNVKHGTGYNTQKPYAAANQETVILTARDNTTYNLYYWIAGQWAPINN